MVTYDLILYVMPLLLSLHRHILKSLQERKKALFALCLAAPLLHYYLAGFRWQVFLLYVLHGLFVLVMGVLILKGGSYRLGYISVMRTSLLFGILCLFFSFSFPLGFVSEPTGLYKIGTASMTYTSQTRRELYGKTYDEPRKFTVQFYYPSDKGGERRAPLIEGGDAVERGLSETFSVPKIILAYMSELPSSAWYDAELSASEKQYPVIILSHGWKGFRNIHADLAQELASQGYIVVAIDHTYGAVATTDDTGTVRYLNPAALPKRNESTQYLKYASALVNTYKEDITETINLLDSLSDQGQNSIFSGRLDMNRLALIGHSTGGGAAVRASIADDRIKAVIGFDAWVEPVASTEILSGLKVPYLHLSSEAWRGGLNEANLDMLLSSSKDDRWLISLEGTKHTDFTMLSRLSPISRFIGLCGPNGKEALVVEQELVSAFLDYYVEGRNTKTAIENIVQSSDISKADVYYSRGK